MTGEDHVDGARRFRILFVDDEVNIIMGLRRMLRPMNDRWAMDFFSDPVAALEAVKKESFDIVIADMRMPVMDGATFLAEVAAVRPETIRFVLSGHSDDSMTMRAVSVAHQWLAKPCEQQVLIDAIVGALSLRDELKNENLLRLTSQLGKLPSLPKIYQEIVAELKHNEPSMLRLGQIISSDVAMSAKVLQIVNSAFFGLPTKVETPEHAAVLLGINHLKTLVLAIHAFEKLEPAGAGMNLLTNLYEHSLEVGACCRLLAKRLGYDDIAINEAYQAGLLHDIGMLVLATKHPDYRKVVDSCIATGNPLPQTETKMLGATHGHVGAYLLGLWGFSSQVQQAVLYHHSPLAAPGGPIKNLTIVHVIDAMLNVHLPLINGSIAEGNIDMEYIEKNDLGEIAKTAAQICNEYMEKRNEDNE